MAMSNGKKAHLVLPAPCWDLDLMPGDVRWTMPACCPAGWRSRARVAAPDGAALLSEPIALSSLATGLVEPGGRITRCREATKRAQR